MPTLISQSEGAFPRSLLTRSANSMRDQAYAKEHPADTPEDRYTEQSSCSAAVKRDVPEPYNNNYCIVETPII